MKKFFALLFLLSFLSSANAIVIVPPAVFFATISILSVVFNMFIGMFFWIAVQGIATKNFFGRPLHSILGFALGSTGKLLFALLVTILLAMVFSPIETSQIVFTSLLTALIFSIALFLSRFRIIRSSQRKQPLIAGIIVFSAAVFVISILSIMLSIQIVSVSTEEKIESPFALGILRVPIQGILPSGAPSAEAPSADIDGKQYEKISFVEALWLLPSSSQSCLLQIDNETLSFAPEKNCFAPNAIGLERVFCPIKVSPSMIAQRGKIQMKASGSCEGSLTAFLSEQGFEVLPDGN